MGGHYVPRQVIEMYRSNTSLSPKDVEGISNYLGEPASPRSARRWIQYLQEGSANQMPEPVSYKRDEDSAGERIKPYRPKANPVYLKSAIFDIETTGFRAGGYKGHLVLCSVLPLDSDRAKTFQIRFEDRSDDRYMLIELLEELWKYDILIHQNGADYDLNFLNTRRMFHGMPTLRSWLYFDTYQTARVLAPKIGKSLECMGYFFQSDGVKTKIGQLLDDVPSPYREDFDRIMKEMLFHCEQDVLMTRDVFNALFVEALTVGTNQFKVTKWKRGVPTFQAWLSEYDIAMRQGA